MFLLLLAVKVLVCHLALVSAEAVADSLWQDTHNAITFSQEEPIKSAWIITPETSVTRDGRFTIDADDMVTISVPNGTHWDADGLASGASAMLRKLDVKTNNGSIGLFAHGDASILLRDSHMVSSGPVGHSVFAAAGGFIYMNNSFAKTAGPRSSIAAASTMLSRIHIENSRGITFGPASPCLLSLGGALNARQFSCFSFQSPLLVVDSTDAVWQDREVVRLDQVDAQVGGPAVILMFDRTTRLNDGPTPQLSLRNTVLAGVQPETIGMWFGNVRGRVDVEQSTIFSNGTLVRAIANMPVLDDLSGVEDMQSGNESTAVIINVVRSSLRGDIMVSGKTLIDLQLTDMSEWVGSVTAEHSDSHVDVSLSQNSQMRLTNHTHVRKLMDDDPTLGNIDSQGFNLTYCKNVSNIAVAVSALAGGGFAVGLPVCV
ncbi:uncharacterized protein PpBr36_09217 [Pyricularia pennisetigena]|uniref:uncharacterized protein n=1 Tax=Pyricularia pennisetigena TaxID=1578925 RepID=UPI00114D5C08|nr:uncharacterized protein PpBr36_09217 [Pyricularia pennisetigena]TLS22059.1 hypothetical protein PpBr36_09217 [Pyricularia pennisetigena]